MHFSEDDLKKALRPEDPGPAFTERVMAGVHQMKARQELEKAARAAASRPKKQWPRWLEWLMVRPALSSAMATLVLLLGIGFGYRQYQQVQMQREQARILELQRAKQAEQQVMLALRITNRKMNHVFKRVNQQMQEEQQAPKNRRQAL